LLRFGHALWFNISGNVAATLAPAACGIANSNNQSVTCTSATDSQANLPGFKCDEGYYLVDNTAPQADTCAPTPKTCDKTNVDSNVGACMAFTNACAQTCPAGYTGVGDPRLDCLPNFQQAGLLTATPVCISMC
jgi:hypothetical protein